MLLPVYTVQGTGTVTGTGNINDQGMKDSMVQEDRKEGREGGEEGGEEGVKEKGIEGRGGNKGKGANKGKGEIKGRRGGDGGGVARDVGTYKALIPILEAAASTSTLPLSSSSTSTLPLSSSSTSSPSSPTAPLTSTSPSTSTSSSTSTLASPPPFRSIDNIELARTTLESVRRTGKIEGLIN